MIKFSISHPYSYFFIPFILLMIVYLGISYFIGVFSKDQKCCYPFDYGASFPFLKSSPSVDIFIAFCGEEFEVIKNTLLHARKIQYDYSLNIYLLDDKGSNEVKALIDVLNSDKYISPGNFINYISRPNKGEMKKAGNIRHAFSKTNGDFILILDADFAPSFDIINDLLPFMMDKNIGIVQSPQYFKVIDEINYIQKGAAYVQELFYRLIQTNRNTYNASVCVGTCALYRRSALAPHGGTANIAYSEDMHTGFQLIKDGWKIHYTPLICSEGLCPDTYNGYINQQYRWCLGSFSLFLTSDFWKAKITLMQKLCYLSGMFFYISTSLGIFLIPLPTLFMLIFYPEYIIWYNIFLSLPSLLFGSIGMMIWTRAKWGTYAIVARNLSYWSYLFAIIDKLKGNLIPWTPTGAASKTNLKKRIIRLGYVWTLLFVTLFLGASIIELSKGNFQVIPSMIMSGNFYFWHLYSLSLLDRND